MKLPTLPDFFDTIENLTLRFTSCQMRPESRGAMDRARGAQSAIFRVHRQALAEIHASKEVPQLAEDEKAVRAGLRRSALTLLTGLALVLLQFPFSFHHYLPENLARLGWLFERFSEYPLVVEVRHSSWSQKDFYSFLHEHGVGFCNIDQPVIGHSVEPGEVATSKNGYVRLHAGRRYDTAVAALTIRVRRAMNATTTFIPRRSWNRGRPESAMWPIIRTPRS